VGYQSILFEQDAGVATLTLHRPEAMNSIDAGLLDELAEAAATCERDPAVRAVILTGSGRAFCVGADIAMLQRIAGKAEAHRLWELAERFHERLILPIRRMAKPVIAAVNGVAAGGGLGLALACDIRVAAAEARFSVAYAGIGVSPDGGTSFFLPRLVGYARAMELYFFNEPLSGEQAQQAGLVNRVVAAAGLLPTVREMAQRLAAGPTFAFGQTKFLFNRAFVNDLASHLAEESRSLGLCASTQDHAAALEAFLAKRRPQFAGR
jgi:2-(1,2-epoxy-1,2-dihydrophenyl)acetyl-CoA isomerase